MLQEESTTLTLVKSSTNPKAEARQSSRIAFWSFCAWRHHCGGWRRNVCREDLVTSTIFFRLQNYETSVWHTGSTELLYQLTFLTGKLKLWLQVYAKHRQFEAFIDDIQLHGLSTSVWPFHIRFGNMTSKRNWCQKLTFVPKLEPFVCEYLLSTSASSHSVFMTRRPLV